MQSIGPQTTWRDAHHIARTGYSGTSGKNLLDFLFMALFSQELEPLQNPGQFTMLAALTYSAPMIGRVTGSAAIANAAGQVGTRAAALIGQRILFMSVGAWISVLSFGVQIIIWVITDDALETWCSLSVFGIKRTANSAYGEISVHRKELEKSLIEIGVL